MRIVRLVLLVLGALALASTDARSAAGPARQRLVFAADRAYPPLEFEENGRLRGLLAQLLDALSVEAPLDFDVRLTDWQAAQRLVLDGHADAVGFLSRSPDREAQFDFTSESLEFTYSAFCRLGDPRVQTPEDLRGLRVGATPAGYPIRFLARDPAVHLVPIATYRQGFEKLLTGEIDAVAADTWVGEYTLQESHIAGVRKVRRPFAYARAGFAVKKGNRAVLAQLDSGLAKLKSSGRLDQLLDDWSSEEVVYLTRGRLNHLLLDAGVGVLAALVALGTAWILVLRRQVRRKTLQLQEANDRLEEHVAVRTADLAASEERYRLLLRTAPVLIVNLGADWRVLGLNAEAERVLGVREPDVLGMDYLRRFIPEEQRPAIDASFRGMLRGARVDGFENEVLVAGGERRRIRWSVCRVDVVRGELVHVLAVGFDVTDQRREQAERQRLQEQLQQAEKLQAVGLLAGGIAHDFNNQLCGILGFATLLAKRQTDAKSREYCETIIRAVEHSSGLTRQLLAFARRGQQRREPTDVHALLRDVAGLLGRSVDKRIEVRLDLAAAATAVEGDPAALQSALLNLAANARDAMPDGGVLTIATRNETDDGQRWLTIQVQDTGCGMTDEVQRRIFEPFFTTKPQGKGSGMGLALVHGTVHAHGGEVSVASRPGEGSVFAVKLPLGERPVAAPREARPAALRGRPRILVVDDERLVLDATVEAIEDLGGVVTGVADGGAAVEAVRAAVGAFDAVVMDLNMPVLDGLAAATVIRQLAPTMKIVLCSGNADEVADGAYGSVAAFLQKPFSVAQLAATLNELL